MQPNDIHLNDTSVSELPYAQRQYIVVVSDEVVDAEKAARRGKLTAKQGLDWEALAKQTLSIAASITVNGASIALVEATAGVVKALVRLRESGINVLAVGQSDAAGLKFPPGHPRQEVLYIGHPAQRDVYYTTAQFHRLTFEHKFAEAVQLLMALGAAEIKVEHQSGWASEFSTQLAATIPHLQTEVKSSTSGSSGHTTQLLFQAHLNPRNSPALPKDLVWFHHEPTWRQIADGRLQYGLKNFSLMLRYEDNFGVNAGLKASASKAGLELGGKFEDHQSTVWRIDGTFADIG